MRSVRVRSVRVLQTGPVCSSSGNGAAGRLLPQALKILGPLARISVRAQILVVM